MIEIINKGIMTCIVDEGRYGYAAVGVPPSAVLDNYAYQTMKRLLQVQEKQIPVLEIIGSRFGIKFHKRMNCAITGARVSAFLDDKPLRPWATFEAVSGSILSVREVTEGLRYYIGFSGKMILEQVIGCFSTNLECSFGGYHGRCLEKGDRIDIDDIYPIPDCIVPDELIPEMKSPYCLRIVRGPEYSSFSEESRKLLFAGEADASYNVSMNSNRTGIRLTGRKLDFCGEKDKSIISEGILPGTIQIPGDGLPIIMLYERTIGGYARIAKVIKTDLDKLAHLKPKDQVVFKNIEIDEAGCLWDERQKKLTSLPYQFK